MRAPVKKSRKEKASLGNGAFFMSSGSSEADRPARIRRNLLWGISGFYAFLLLFLGIGFLNRADAYVSESDHSQIDIQMIGCGGETSQSDYYRAVEIVHAMPVGKSQSTNYSIAHGFAFMEDPVIFLESVVARGDGSGLYDVSATLLHEMGDPCRVHLYWRYDAAIDPSKTLHDATITGPVTVQLDQDGFENPYEPTWTYNTRFVIGDEVLGSLTPVYTQVNTANRVTFAWNARESGQFDDVTIFLSAFADNWVESGGSPEFQLTVDTFTPAATFWAKKLSESQLGMDFTDTFDPLLSDGWMPPEYAPFWVSHGPSPGEEGTMMIFVRNLTTGHQFDVVKTGVGWPTGIPYEKFDIEDPKLVLGTNILRAFTVDSDGNISLIDDITITFAPETGEGNTNMADYYEYDALGLDPVYEDLPDGGLPPGGDQDDDLVPNIDEYSWSTSSTAGAGGHFFIIDDIQVGLDADGETLVVTIQFPSVGNRWYHVQASPDPFGDKMDWDDIAWEDPDLSTGTAMWQIGQPGNMTFTERLHPSTHNTRFRYYRVLVTPQNPKEHE